MGVHLITFKNEVTTIKQDTQLLKAENSAIQQHIQLLKSAIEKEIIFLRADNSAIKEGINLLTFAVKHEILLWCGGSHPYHGVLMWSETFKWLA
jgi:hypothetical protein